MGKQVTFGHILTILSIIVLPFITWGVNVERRFEKMYVNTNDIKEIKEDYKSNSSMMLKNHKEQMEKLHAIELQLKDKVNR